MTPKKIWSTVAVVAVAILGAWAVIGYYQSWQAGQLSDSVKDSMQHTFDTNANFKDAHLTVDGVQVVHKGGNSYQGIADVKMAGVEHSVLVNITADGSNMLWQTDSPGEMAFVAQAQIDAAAKALQDLSKAADAN